MSTPIKQHRTELTSNLKIDISKKDVTEFLYILVNFLPKNIVAKLDEEDDKLFHEGMSSHYRLAYLMGQVYCGLEFGNWITDYETKEKN